jgi:hypothetical protein
LASTTSAYALAGITTTCSLSLLPCFLKFAIALLHFLTIIDPVTIGVGPARVGDILQFVAVKQTIAVGCISV